MMKTLLLTLLCNGLIAIGSWAGPIKKMAVTAPVSIEQQLARRLTYPQALQGNTENSVVIVQFRLDEHNRVRNPQVFSADQSLNDELIRQLIRLKLVPTEPAGYVEPLYTARLRFQVTRQPIQTTAANMVATR